MASQKTRHLEVCLYLISFGEVAQKIIRHVYKDKRVKKVIVVPFREYRKDPTFLTIGDSLRQLCHIKVRR